MVKGNKHTRTHTHTHTHTHTDGEHVAYGSKYFLKMNVSRLFKI